LHDHRRGSLRTDLIKSRTDYDQNECEVLKPKFSQAEVTEDRSDRVTLKMRDMNVRGKEYAVQNFGVENARHKNERKAEYGKPFLAKYQYPYKCPISEHAADRGGSLLHHLGPPTFYRGQVTVGDNDTAEALATRIRVCTSRIMAYSITDIVMQSSLPAIN